MIFNCLTSQFQRLSPRGDSSRLYSKHGAALLRFFWIEPTDLWWWTPSVQVITIRSRRMNSACRASISMNTVLFSSQFDLILWQMNDWSPSINKLFQLGLIAHLYETYHLCPESIWIYCFNGVRLWNKRMDIADGSGDHFIRCTICQRMIHHFCTGEVRSVLSLQP